MALSGLCLWYSNLYIESYPFHTRPGLVCVTNRHNKWGIATQELDCKKLCLPSQVFSCLLALSPITHQVKTACDMRTFRKSVEWFIGIQVNSPQTATDTRRRLSASTWKWILQACATFHSDNGIPQPNSLTATSRGSQQHPPTHYLIFVHQKLGNK